MPNAARLVAALCLALLAFVVSGLVKETFPDGTYFGNFTLYNIGLGLIVGWVVMGKRAGRGFTPAINNGLTGVVVLAFWCVFVQGLAEMTDLAMRNRYGGPFEALVDSLRLTIEFALVLVTPNILIASAVGAIGAGLATEAAKKMWR
jgi:hypothetical protein